MLKTNRKLGRLAHDPAFVATLPKLADFMPSAEQWPVTGVDWSRNMPPDGWNIYGNDSLGDCTAAAVGHAIMTWGSYGKLSYTPLTNSDVISLYQATGGYVPGNPTTDRGALCTDVLQYWTGNPVGERRLTAFATVDPKNADYIKAAVCMFGGLYVGITLTEDQANQDTGTVWDVDRSQIAGGHCVWIVAANDVGLRCITWGATQDMTWAFWRAQGDEAYACLHPLWLTSGRSPDGFQTQALVNAMADL